MADRREGEEREFTLYFVIFWAAKVTGDVN
jgi:hypothetical protein